MPDPRINQLARVIVNALKIQEHEQILIPSSSLSEPLTMALYTLVLKRGAHPLLFTESDERQRIFFTEAMDHHLDSIPSILRYAYEHADASIQLYAPQNTRELATIDPRRIQRYKKAIKPFTERLLRGEARWVVSAFPTPALAQEADMSLSDYEDFLYSAVDIDIEAMHTSMETAVVHFDQAREVRIKASGTDITLNIEGRKGVLDTSEIHNIPCGEFFYAPLEHKTEGTITYDWPAVFSGREVAGIQLTFNQGKVVNATADKGEDFLLEALNTDDGARYLGELGIGCNHGITRQSKSILFDEKIGGTVHLALGAAYDSCGGTNKSTIHWDMVKDLRPGGEIYLDGRLVQKNGEWVF
ncbi:aminopeptidase [Mechercharimyces sp. CAU 1602]|uniref:aminopeptidase n=1 Tax=Mechercharimyces sp. CAU 1602 TaxID=2973933 RepID=UPI002162AFC1|nr:aminopeptidase [Mechercharimyces sp. CAU 1602]MCS1351767.1 aminopeptidase [Mechercharimyces sp. CAU 1602]